MGAVMLQMEDSGCLRFRAMNGVKLRRKDRWQCTVQRFIQNSASGVVIYNVRLRILFCNSPQSNVNVERDSEDCNLLVFMNLVLILPACFHQHVQLTFDSSPLHTF